MGYTTKFVGELKFTKEPTLDQIKKVKSFFDEDVRDHPDWDAEGSYIDLMLSEDFTGIEWNPATEKNSGMVSHINLIINEMRKDDPDFGLTGILEAQGEDRKDKWVIVIENGVAVRKDKAFAGKVITCPHCGQEIEIDETGNILNG